MLIMIRMWNTFLEGWLTLYLCYPARILTYQPDSDVSFHERRLESVSLTGSFLNLLFASMYASRLGTILTAPTRSTKNRLLWKGQLELRRE